ncbi:hypothetical protein AW27_003045 [Streptomyces sp. PCS3-D2]|uniref:hypothetical protein n=1 Tax=Streptomyces sp. PCS3-D2 TaxID=1460244 RepID=UPI00044CAA0B|nr:hypothetical protein [Streptomyces sp. PCS3-D2]WKV70582.1 hypothetical protein AW27_003045 [Streptomyces sp. PCS3-D2]
MALGALTMAGLLPATADAAILNSDLEVIRLDPDPATPGSLTTVHAMIANLGPATTTARFTVNVQLPEGTTAEAPFYPDNCHVLPGSRGRRVRCTMPARLAPEKTVTALIPARIGEDTALGILSGGLVQIVAPLDDRTPDNNEAPFTVAVVE